MIRNEIQCGIENIGLDVFRKFHWRWWVILPKKGKNYRKSWLIMINGDGWDFSNSWKSGAFSFNLVLGLMLLFMLLCAFGMTLEIVIVPSKISFHYSRRWFFVYFKRLGFMVEMWGQFGLSTFVGFCIMTPILGDDVYLVCILDVKIQATSCMENIFVITSLLKC